MRNWTRAIMRNYVQLGQASTMPAPLCAIGRFAGILAGSGVK